MRYACLAYMAGFEPVGGPDERVRLLEDVRICEQEMWRSGYLVSAYALQPVEFAVTVRVREERCFTVDGAATGAGEHLSRLLLVDARDLNEAMRVAARHPYGRVGSIEVRPLDPAGGNDNIHAG